MVGSTVLFWIRASLTTRGGRSCSGAASKRNALRSKQLSRAACSRRGRVHAWQQQRQSQEHQMGGMNGEGKKAATGGPRLDSLLACSSAGSRGDDLPATGVPQFWPYSTRWTWTRCSGGTYFCRGGPACACMVACVRLNRDTLCPWAFESLPGGRAHADAPGPPDSGEEHRNPTNNVNIFL